MKRKQILRWVAVVPGALLGAVIVMFPVHFPAGLRYDYHDDFDQEPF